MLTPSSGNFIESIPESTITRLKRVKSSAVAKNRRTPISFYTSDNTALASIAFKPIMHLQSPYISSPSLNLDVLWHAGWLFRDKEQPRPNWNGFMQDITISRSEYPPAGEIRILSIIDMNPNDMTGIYSTLLFIERQAIKHGMETACVMFDQPLWLKAVKICQAKQLKVVCRLGAFHVMMSFLGSMGKIMEGSGLVEALETSFGPVAVSHMMTGKAFARALRGHFMTESDLVILLMLKVTQNCEEDGSDDTNTFDGQDMKELQL